MSATFGPEVLPYPQPTDAPDGPGAFFALLQAMQTGGPYVQATLTALNAVTGKYVNQVATVNADTTLPNNGDYRWSGTAWIAQDTGWIPLPLSGTWVYFGGGIYAVPQYRKKNGMTIVEGLIKSGSGGAGQILATLPPLFRPAAQLIKASGGSTGATTLEVCTNGTIIAGAGGVSTTYTSLDMTFLAEQ